MEKATARLPLNGCYRKLFCSPAERKCAPQARFRETDQLSGAMTKPIYLDYKPAFRTTRFPWPRKQSGAVVRLVRRTRKHRQVGRDDGRRSAPRPHRSLQGVLAKKVSEQRAYFEGQLSQLGGYVAKKASAAAKAVTPGKGKRRKSEAKVSVEEKQVCKVDRARHDPGLDARGDEGHQAQEKRFPDQVVPA